MLTRLRVSGFKNLVDVDVRFGPFTCIAGANGVGKSNLLDAILFLGRLADKTLLDAALSVRGEGARSGDVRGLFHHVGDCYADRMTFQAEMIIPEKGVDDLGQIALASSTFVEYSVTLGYRKEEGDGVLGGLELLKEELRHITLSDARHHLLFRPSRQWRDAHVKNKRRTPNYISTEGDGPERVINVHQDGGSSGKPQKLLASNLPRTVLSAANSAESPTATLAKREMQSWRLLQLEPSALREPDGFAAPAQIASDGTHVPATLYRLAHRAGADAAAVYTEVANRVSELIHDIRSIHVDRDERRQLLSLYAVDRDGTTHPARSLSDGTLRFLALAVLQIDPGAQGLVCMEEPENGIHPERIPAMIELLQDLATGVDVDENEPLRQVIVNTHSPAVVMQVPEDSLVVAQSVESTDGNEVFRALQLAGLPGTWRAKPEPDPQTVSKGQLLAYLNPVGRREEISNGRSRPRVVDREDLRQLLLPLEEIAR